MFENVQNDRAADNGLTHEHTVPKNILIRLISAFDVKSYDNILTILDDYAFATIITNEEDRLINANGLRDLMPNQEITNFLDRYSDTFAENNEFYLFNLNDLNIKTPLEFLHNEQNILNKITLNDIFSI